VSARRAWVLGAVLAAGLAGPACAPVPPRPADPAPPRDDLMALVPGPLQSLLAVDVGQLRRSPWAQPVIESAAPADGRQRRGFDEIRDVDRWLFATVRAAGSGSGTLELGRGRFDRTRIEAAFRERHPSAQERRFGSAAGLADSEAALTFPAGGTVALGPIWAVQAAVRAAQPGAPGRPELVEPWLAEAAGMIDRTIGRAAAAERRPAVELWLRLDERSRAELTALVGDASAVDWIAGRLTLAADVRVVAIAQAGGAGEAAALAGQLGQLLTALGARRSVQALGLASVLERAEVETRGSFVVLALAVSEDERDELSQRLAALARVLRSRAETPPP
jgi:hypothetical protein